MKKIIVMGLANLESNVYVESFPVNYSPIEYSFFSEALNPSGVAVNLACAFKALGDDPFVISMLGNDLSAKMIELFLNEKKIPFQISHTLKETPFSTVLFDHQGKRKIFCDLKDIQEVKFNEEINYECELACLTNTNFVRPYLSIFKEKGIKIACDCHVVCDINDDFNKDFMELSDILFVSDENIKDNYYQFMEELIKAYDKEIIVISRGDKGALMYVKKDNSIRHFEAYKCGKIVNTVGAGDALFSAFNHFYLDSKDAYYSIDMAMRYATIKISSNGGAQGFVGIKEFMEMK